MQSINRIFTHPGEMLREEFMVPMNLSANALAIGINVPVSRILDIIHERRGVSADTAVRLAKYFGTTERFWTNLQAEYDLSIVHQEKKSDLDRIVPHVPSVSVAEGLASSSA